MPGQARRKATSNKKGERGGKGRSARPRFARRDDAALEQAGFAGKVMGLPFQAQLEEELGVDLSTVTAYLADPAALAELGANAIASGDFVAFASSSPSYDQVKEEVIHLLQQGRGQGRGVSDPSASSERSAKAGLDAGTGADASVHRDEATAADLPQKAAEIAELTIADGLEYTVTEADMAEGSESSVWRAIARAHGMHPDYLVPFNQHVETVEVAGELADLVKTPSLAAGVTLYIPSAEELAFAQCRKKGGDMDAAVALYGELAAGSNIKVVSAARDRGSGRKGKSYGNKGVDGYKDQAGVFLTPNKELAGAKSTRSEVIDGQREYRVNWNATASGFWKCSVFLHDVVFQAGFAPHVTDNKHYQLAGRLNESDKVTEIPVSEAGPGALWQRFGGRGSDESHNAILTSFVDVTPIEGDDEHETWSFSILGAEQSSAGESMRNHRIKKGTNENTGGKKIRFFKPKGS